MNNSHPASGRDIESSCGRQAPLKHFRSESVAGEVAPSRWGGAFFFLQRQSISSVSAEVRTGSPV